MAGRCQKFEIPNNQDKAKLYTCNQIQTCAQYVGKTILAENLVQHIPLFHQPTRGYK